MSTWQYIASFGTQGVFYYGGVVGVRLRIARVCFMAAIYMGYWRHSSGRQYIAVRAGILLYRHKLK